MQQMRTGGNVKKTGRTRGVGGAIFIRSLRQKVVWPKTFKAETLDSL
jgi:hypothetical protein